MFVMRSLSTFGVASKLLGAKLGLPSNHNNVLTRESKTSDTNH
jgi:hypothetical protein